VGDRRHQRRDVDGWQSQRDVRAIDDTFDVAVEAALSAARNTNAVMAGPEASGVPASAEPMGPSMFEPPASVADLTLPHPAVATAHTINQEHIEVFVSAIARA